MTFQTIEQDSDGHGLHSPAEQVQPNGQGVPDLLHWWRSHDRVPAGDGTSKCGGYVIRRRLFSNHD